MTSSILLQGFLLQAGFGSFWSLLTHGGIVADLVLVILLGFSVLSWSIMYRKHRSYQEARRQDEAFYESFMRSSSLSEIFEQAQRYEHSPRSGLYRSAYREIRHQVDASKENTSGGRVTSLNGVERSLQRAAVLELTGLEQSLHWLATTASVTPFVGLFGTVVGIINAFQGLGQGTGTTIQAVAPGISQALVATAAGLFAAIPAVIGYNHFVRELKVFGAEMDDFASELLNLLERNLT